METEIKETENKEVSQDGLRNEEEERKFEAEVKRQEQEELKFDELINDDDESEEKKEIKNEDNQGKLFNQEQANHAFAELKKKEREAELRAKEAERRLKEIEEKSNVKQPLPPVPPMPDRDDYDFDQKLAERNRIQRLHDKRAWEEEQNQKIQAIRENDTIAAKQRQYIEDSKRYLERANTIGINMDSLVKYGETINNFGLDMDIQNTILRHEKGPMIAQHLASDIHELSKIATMPKTDALLYLASDVLPKIKPQKKLPPPKTSEGLPHHGKREISNGDPLLDGYFD